MSKSCKMILNFLDWFLFYFCKYIKGKRLNKLIITIDQYNVTTAAAIPINTIATIAISKWLGLLAIVPIKYSYFFFIAYSECPVY